MNEIQQEINNMINNEQELIDKHGYDLYHFGLDQLHETLAMLEHADEWYPSNDIDDLIDEIDDLPF